MKIQFLILALVATVVSAEMGKGPKEYWDISRNRNDSSYVTIYPVDNIQKVCDLESKKLGHGGYGVPLDACSFWSKTIIGYRCDIYVGKKTNNDILGHEMRHCLQGSFHSYERSQAKLGLGAQAAEPCRV